MNRTGLRFEKCNQFAIFSPNKQSKPIAIVVSPSNRIEVYRHDSIEFELIRLAIMHNHRTIMLAIGSLYEEVIDLSEIDPFKTVDIN